MTDSWCILRTSGRLTLPLAEALEADGFKAWSPVEVQRHKRTRARKRVPIMPTFVFAEADRLPDLLEMAEAPAPKVGFSVFRHYERIPLIADDELRPLRRAEARAVPEEEWPTFERDQPVTVTEGPYGGVSGKVIRSRGEWALVLFGWHRVKISCFCLRAEVAKRLVA